MKKILDPLDHGTTSIKYLHVSLEYFFRLKRILHNGWDIDISDLRIIENPRSRSINYFVADGDKRYLLKDSFLNTVESQEFQHKIMAYLGNLGLLIPKAIPSKKGTVFQVDDNQNVYSLYGFIEGEYFDGSHEELRSAARNIATLEDVLGCIPFQEEIKLKKGALVCHDHSALDEIEEKVLFLQKDKKIISILPYLKDLSAAVVEAPIEKLPFQVIHRDLHPHNLLFENKKLKAFLDFDPMLYSQRIRDVGKALYRLSRTYGPLTERKQDSDSDLLSRARFFLESYLEVGTLMPDEFKALPYIIIDDPLYHLIESLKKHYFEGKELTNFEKKFTLLKEATLFLTAEFP